MTRDLKISNLKGLLIIFVVLGHLLELYKADFKELYYLIYTFHMPLFIFISGYLAKRASMKKVFNLLFIYLLFQTLYRFYFYISNHQKQLKLNLEVPYYHLWYLISMITWYLFAIGMNHFKLLKWQKIILFMVFFITGLVTRYYAGTIVENVDYFFPSFYSYTFSYQRTITFFPFFFMGLNLTEGTMKKLQKSLKQKWFAAVITITGLYLFYMHMDGSNLEKILKGSYGVNKLKGSIYTISWELILGYLFALLMCYLFLNLIGDKKSFLTRLGDSSLPIYLFHVFFILIIKRMKFLDTCPPVLLLILFIVYTIFIVWVLSTSVFIKLTYALWNPMTAISNVNKKMRLVIYDHTNQYCVRNKR